MAIQKRHVDADEVLRVQHPGTGIPDGPGESPHGIPERVSVLHRHRQPGRRFSSKKILLKFWLENGLRFHFDSETCMNCPFLNIFSV